MITHRFANSEEDIKKILPLLISLCESTGANLMTSLQEISSPEALIHIREESGVIVGYTCGHFLNKEDFYICQTYNRLPDNESIIIGEHEYSEKVKELGGKRIFAYTVHPTIFEKYGFRVERYVVRKDLEEKEMTKEVFFQLFTKRWQSLQSFVSHEVLKERVRHGVCPFEGLRKQVNDRLQFKKERHYYLSQIQDASFKNELLYLIEMEVENG